ncbi:hypothetical protein [Bacillus sp. ISL-55]|uniref:hypothetical protein n=1 Tax=Bacillus sp. ISL-55 TaxID=2819134 RepID=UPI001BE7339E|nr:hypothetical protein [Bacillus sp. ISL-55]MBT2692767.1 hypothetical protein [Bacillus sp. ISL-55]
MKKSTKNFVLASLLSAGGAVLLTAAYRKSQRDAIRFLEDTDMRNSEKIDQSNNKTSPICGEVFMLNNGFLCRLHSLFFTMQKVIDKDSCYD